MKLIYRLVIFSAVIIATFAQAVSTKAEFISAVATQGGNHFLITWDSASPSDLISSRPILNLNTFEALIGIDFRPSTKVLYGLLQQQNSYQVITIRPTIGNNVARWSTDSFGGQVNGFSHGFDFNPVIDRIRVVTDTNKNYVFDPVSGNPQLVATDLFYGPADPNFGKDPNVGAVAYSNNTPTPPASTQLFGIDTGLDILVTQANNSGTLSTVGPLGVDVSSLVGFDISGETGVAYAVMTPAGSSQSSFYSIDLATGTATSLGVVGGGVVVTAMSVGIVPEPSTAAMTLLAIVGLTGVRRGQRV
jgi:hypothetical protein